MNRRSIRQGTKGLLSVANIMKKEDLQEEASLELFQNVQNQIVHQIRL